MSDYVHYKALFNETTLDNVDTVDTTNLIVTDELDVTGATITGLTTEQITEAVNLYYTEARVSANTDVSANTTHRGRTDNPHSVTLTQLGLNDELKNLTTSEIQQLQNINLITISNPQWGYLGSFDQGLSTSDAPSYTGLTLTGTDPILTFSGTTTNSIYFTDNKTVGLDIGTSGASFITLDSTTGNKLITISQPLSINNTVNLNNLNQIEGVVDPTKNQDVATKNYVDTHTSGNYLRLDGTNAMSANLNMNSNRITNLSDGITGVDAVNLSQLQQYLPLIGNLTNPMTGAIVMGGQKIYGNNTVGGNLTLESTSNASKGEIDMLNNVDMNSNKITGLTAGSASGEAVEYDQLNTVLGSYLPLTGGTLTGTLNGTTILMNTSAINTTVARSEFYNSGWTPTGDRISCLRVGESNTARNEGSICWYRAGDGSTANRLEFGINNVAFDTFAIGGDGKCYLNGDSDVSGILSANDTTNSTSTSTGALQVAGGIGVSKDIFLDGQLTYSGTGANILIDSTNTGATTGQRRIQLIHRDSTNEWMFQGLTDAGGFNSNIMTLCPVGNGNGYVGINRNQPTVPLDVNGATNISGVLTMSDNINMNSNNIINLTAGASTGQAVEYDQMNTAINNAVALYLPLTGGTISSDLYVQGTAYTDRIISGNTTTTSAGYITKGITLIGTSASLAGPHIDCVIDDGDDVPAVEVFAWNHGIAGLAFDCYYDGTQWRSSYTGSNFLFYKDTNQLSFWYNSGVAVGTQMTGGSAFNKCAYFNTSGHFLPGSDSSFNLGASGTRWSNVYADAVNVAGSILPDADSTRDIGASGTRWANIYADNLDTDTMNITGQITFDEASDSGIIAGLTRTGLVLKGANSGSNSWVRVGQTNDLLPYNDNAMNLGNGTYRWIDVWAVDGTINTSDETEKKDVVDSDLGLDFINDLKPKKYKWKEGKRPHYGLMAQEVKQIIGEKDFGGYIEDDKEDGSKFYGLRYTEFIAPMIKAIQELTEKVKSLESQLNP
jgi:hypothetical protein